METVALVRLPPARNRRTESFPDLPPLPPSCSALVVRCRSPAELEAALRWRVAAGAHRPDFPTALVLPRDAEMLRTLALSPTRVDHVCFVDELEVGGGVAAPLLDSLLRRSRAGALADELLGVLPVEVAPEDRHLLTRIAEAGAAGDSVKVLCRGVGLSESTFRRRLRDRDLPAPKLLLRVLRLRAVQRAIAAGAAATSAAAASGWTTAEAYAISLRRTLRAKHAPWVAALLARPRGG